jgi:hypothetical protein
MIYEKERRGIVNLDHKTIVYYIINRSGNYGVAIEEETDGKFLCDYAYISEKKEEVEYVTQLLYNGQVTGITFPYILDDYMGSK